MSKFADHPDLQGLDSEQLAELPLLGVKYRSQFSRASIPDLAEEAHEYDLGIEVCATPILRAHHPVGHQEVIFHRSADFVFLQLDTHGVILSESLEKKLCVWLK